MRYKLKILIQIHTLGVNYQLCLQVPTKCIYLPDVTVRFVMFYFRKLNIHCKQSWTLSQVDDIVIVLLIYFLSNVWVTDYILFLANTDTKTFFFLIILKICMQRISYSTIFQNFSVIHFFIHWRTGLLVHFIFFTGYFGGNCKQVNVLNCYVMDTCSNWILCNIIWCKTSPIR